MASYLDGDPATDGKLDLTASREAGTQRSLGPVVFQPASEPGVYTVAFDYPAYGKWLTRVRVMEPGKGDAALREEVLPPVAGGLGAIPAASTRVRIVSDFGWREATDIAVRALHMIAAAIWFAATGLVLAASLWLSGLRRDQLLRRLSAAFPIAVTVSMILLGLTGLYNAVYNVPARSPGLLDPNLIARLSFGDAYLMAFSAKMILASAILAVSVALAVVVNRAYASRLPTVAGVSRPTLLPARRVERWVVRLSATNLALGLLVLIDVVVIGYLHILTHIGGLGAPR